MGTRGSCLLVLAIPLMTSCTAPAGHGPSFVELLSMCDAVAVVHKEHDAKDGKNGDDAIKVTEIIKDHNVLRSEKLLAASLKDAFAKRSKAHTSLVFMGGLLGDLAGSVAVDADPQLVAYLKGMQKAIDRKDEQALFLHCFTSLNNASEPVIGDILQM